MAPHTRRVGVLFCSRLSGFTVKSGDSALEMAAAFCHIRQETHCKPEQTASPAGLLVIGYGNTLRSDDGVGPREWPTPWQPWPCPGVRAQAFPLLTPELADPVSQARVVVFVDCCGHAPREVQMRKLAPAELPRSWLTLPGESGDFLLALARDVFGHCPRGLAPDNSRGEHWYRRGAFTSGPTRFRDRGAGGQEVRRSRPRALVHQTVAQVAQVARVTWLQRPAARGTYVTL